MVSWIALAGHAQVLIVFPVPSLQLDALDPAVRALSSGSQESDRQQWMHTLRQAIKVGL